MSYHYSLSPKTIGIWFPRKPDKSFGDEPGTDGEMYQILKQGDTKTTTRSRGAAVLSAFRQLPTGEVPNDCADRAGRVTNYLWMMSVKKQFRQKKISIISMAVVAAKCFAARKVALENTKHYLSIVIELDVYVATSMRNRQDFREMARFCDEVFNHESVARLGLRYFDPTLSAAFGHEDKGLIECLMVKCAKVLVYCAGSRDSYGKDAEAAMALSLGKPVVFYCDQDQRSRLPIVKFIP